MRKMNSFFMVLAAFCFLASSLVTPLPLRAADDFATIKLSSGKIYKVTKAQVESLKNQPGVQFSETLPEKLAGGQIAVIIPAELGGGYIIGTAQALASAFNSAGITVGLTPAAITGISPQKKGVTTVAVAMAGILAASLSGNGTAAHHHAPAHHAPSHH